MAEDQLDTMDSMDLDMEMDVDVDLIPDEPIIPEPDVREASGNRSDGEVDDDPDAPALTKVHIRGLDILIPDEVKAYVAEHYPENPVERIEWIDDSSANLWFPSEAAAAQALTVLAVEPIQHVAQHPARQLVPAKSFSKRPEVALQVRPALASDKKEVGAASRSRFYLLHPEYDPEERRRRNDAKRYRDRDGASQYRQRPRQRREDEPVDSFDVSLYDDDAGALASRVSKPEPRRRRSYTPDSDRGYRRRDSYRNENRGKELFPAGTGGGNSVSRDRSASPARDRDGDRSMDGFSSDGSAARDRNRNRARAIKSNLSRGSRRTMELFPEKSNSAGGRLGDSKEDAATLLAKGITLPLMDGSSDVAPSQSRKLEDRVTTSGKGRLADRITSPDSTKDTAFNIRGTANQRNPDQGFAIKGTAGKSAKELFPDKFGSNAGRELFAETLGGRSRRRQRAGDLFD